MKSPLVIAIVVILGFHLRAADAPNAAAAAAPRPAFKAGFAERDITPDLGMEEPGGYGKAYHRTFHDPCKVRAAVFDEADNESRSSELTLFITRALTKEARAEIGSAAGIGWGISSSPSHLHSSGPLAVGVRISSRPAARAGFVFQQVHCLESPLHAIAQASDRRSRRRADAARVDAKAAAGFGHEDKVVSTTACG
jgi:hypothetical protein